MRIVEISKENVMAVHDGMVFTFGRFALAMATKVVGQYIDSNG